MKQKLLEKLLWLPVLVFLATLTSWPQVSLGTAEIESPDLNVILKHLEHAQHQDPAQSRRYEVMREYKVFHGDDKQPTSEVMAQINFVPPDIKTYKMGNPRGEKMVRELLDRETESAKKGRSSEINRMNYDFVFLGMRTSASFLSTFCESSPSGRINTFYAGGSG